METKNEKDLRMYIQPETEAIELKTEANFCKTGEDGDDGGDM